VSASSGATADEVRNERYDEQDDEDPEQQARAFHGNARNPAEAYRCGDQGYDEKYDGIVKQTEARHRFLQWARM